MDYPKGYGKCAVSRQCAYDWHTKSYVYRKDKINRSAPEMGQGITLKGDYGNNDCKRSGKGT